MAEWFSPTGVHSKCGEHAASPVTQLIDGNTGSRWLCQAWHEHFVILDLGERKMVEQVRIYSNGSTSCSWLKSVSVYVSDDPEDWGAAVTSGWSFVTEGSSQWNTRNVTDKAGRYIKVVIPHTYEPEGWEACPYEFEAYVSDAPPPPAEAQPYSFIM